MTVVFVHGNPETAAIWDPLRAALGRTDTIALSPPGFGAPVPDGFGATSDEYRDWLITELQELSTPIDLVGHDWGGGHVARAVTARPDLVRSWCFDIAGCMAPDYVWHDMAQVWQEPGSGEAAIAAMASRSFDERVAGYIGMGMTPDAARSCVEAGGPAMGRCILDLYRSAAQPHMAEWGAELIAAPRPPCLVIAPTDDHFTGGIDRARVVAERLGASFEVLDGLGHWWMLQDPVRGAAVLSRFFASL